MRRTRSYISFAVLLVAAIFVLQVSAPPLPGGRGSDSFATPARVASPAARQQLVASYGRLPLSFEANQGQSDGTVKFLSRGNGYKLFLTVNEAVLTLRRSQESEVRSQKEVAGSSLVTRHSSLPPAVLRMKLVGANPNPEVVGEG